MSAPEKAHGSEESLCLPAFGTIQPDRLITADDLFALVRDKFPVAPGHTLIIPRREVAQFADLTDAEKAGLMNWIQQAQRLLLETLSPVPDGFNLGINDGAAAGQTIPQFHFHIIPRYKGDVPDPRGGIRWIMPEKARYW